MLQSFKKILNSSLHAKDGKIGHLDDLLFDDVKWTVRYLVVRTGGILNRERVLISPLGIAKLDWSNRAVKLNLTQQQIETSPDIDTDQPIFRQMEKKYFDFYNWPYYWDDMGIFGIDPRAKLNENKSKSKQSNTKQDPHLRSCRIVSGYSIEAENTRVGHVEDFLIEDETWTIQNLLVHKKTLWPNRPKMIDTKSIDSVDWFSRSIELAMTKKEIESSPEFESDIIEAHP
ncbi:MAG: hypothetical protein ACXVLQ_06640 [Bacteriovorax sp.]